MLENHNGKINGKVEINGRTYQTVAYRLAEFRKQYPIASKWNIETECLHRDEKEVVFKATIKTPDGQVVATGHAEEKRDSSYINRTSAYENCETSAIGRALATAGFIGSEFASADEVALAIQAQASQASQASQAEAKLHPKETNPQPIPQTSQAAMPKEAGLKEPVQTQPEPKPTSQAAESSQPNHAAEPTSQVAEQAKPSEAKNQAKQNGQAKQAEPNQATAQPAEEIAELWIREHLAEWLDAPCPYVKAQGRTWRELAENQGEKIAMKGKGFQPPRAYLHALESWTSGKIWQRMKARVALEVGKNGNGIPSLA
jgi:outer membrane biosynthesis protein TonB